MPGQRLTRFQRRLNLRAALVRATVAEVEGRLSQYESADLDLARAVIRDCQDGEDADMILEALRRHQSEREAGADDTFTDWIRELHNSPVTMLLEDTIPTVSAWRARCEGEGSQSQS